MSPRYAEPYTLYTRKMKDGREVYYYRARDPATGGRLPGRSTGLVSEREAFRWCEARLADGTLIPGAKEVRPPAQVRRSRRPPTLAEWAAERKWWQWTDEGPSCEYCKGELKRSHDEAPAVQREYADKCARVLKDKILPDHGDKRIDHITPLECEDLLAGWSAAGLSNKTINNYSSVYRVMMREAARLGVIPVNPWAAVKGYRAAKGGKGILSLDEYRALMAPDSLGERWSRAIYYDVNLLASVTGLRMSECLALHPEDVHADHITIAVKWRIGYGEGPQKTKRGTDQLPIPKFLADRLGVLAKMTPPGKYIFSLGDGKRPCTANRVEDALISALEAIKIDDKTRRARKISFHSWRAFANTYFRASNVPDAKIRQITRHVTEEMTDHYSAFRLEDFREIAEAQAALVADFLPSADG